MSAMLPFTYKVGLNAQSPSPGAYILVGGSGANGLVPIYTSMPSFIISTALSEFLNDKDAQVLVLPGYNIELYPNTLYGGTVTSFDNRAGTDILYRNASLAATSCKLFYKFRTGYAEVASNVAFVDVTVTTSPSVTPTSVLYNSINYNLYQFTTVGANTFSITSATDVSALVLLVAGGGAGGASLNGQEAAGGGGAGGVAIGTIHIPRNTQHTCTIGNGGQTQNASGGDSTLTNNVNSQRVTVKGGGGGAYVGNGQTAGSGGSGGGANAGYSKGFWIGYAQTATGNNIAGITNYYGNNGGSCWGTSGAHLGGGGGGGATSNGGNAHGEYTQVGGGGGAGYTWPVNNIVYAGGGGGGSGANTADWRRAPGGSGGGGAGGVFHLYDPADGANTRGAGGGGGQSYHTVFGKGGSGIIIVAIPQYAVAA